VTAYAVSSSGQSDIKGAHSGFAVLATTTGSYLATTQPFVAPGSEVIVSGSGFADSKPITISLLGTTVATTTTTATGRIPRTKVVIPMSAVFGQTSLKATGKRSRTATAAITIANNWDEVGYGPSHTGFEPADNTFYNHITPGDDIFLDTAWRYQFGAPIDTAPAVADEVAYEGNTTGQLVAIDVHNGAPLWTWSLPSGAAIDGDPAVDPFKGLVFVGADDGTLDAVSTSTGKLVWSTSIGGDLAAPVYGDGEVYVTSSTGTVEAVVESTGAKSWAVVLGSAVSAAPSLDTVAATLVVGESNGTVSALATATGATEWTNSSVGAVTSATTISDGTVYFGSGDSVEAVNEATGVEDWSFPTSGPVTDSPALANDGRWLLIGSGDGNLYDLETSNGSLIWKVAIDHPIIGVATVNSMVVFDTSSGLVGAARTWAEPILLWKKQTGAGITSPPAIVDGTVYVGAGDWYLYAFTTYGQPPQ
jgi:outer membrane protein assembly factor BamB